MAFEVIPFCRIVKFSGITRFLYQFWKILPKYCGRKEKDHNILWSKWYSRRESNPQRPLRRGLLYPFNYGSISCYPAGNTSSLRSSCHRRRWAFQAKAVSSNSGTLGTFFILQRFAQKGNCFRGGSLKVPPRRPDRGFCRKMSFKHLTMRREYV